MNNKRKKENILTIFLNNRTMNIKQNKTHSFYDNIIEYTYLPVKIIYNI